MFTHSYFNNNNGYNDVTLLLVAQSTLQRIECAFDAIIQLIFDNNKRKDVTLFFTQFYEKTIYNTSMNEIKSHMQSTLQSTITLLSACFSYNLFTIKAKISLQK